MSDDEYQAEAERLLAALDGSHSRPDRVQVLKVALIDFHYCGADKGRTQLAQLMQDAGR